MVNVCFGCETDEASHQLDNREAYALPNGISDRPLMSDRLLVFLWIFSASTRSFCNFVNFIYIGRVGCNWPLATTCRLVTILLQIHGLTSRYIAMSTSSPRSEMI